MYRTFPIIVLAVLMAAGPASAESPAKKAEDVHAPTNRVGAEVPTMTTEKGETKEQADTDTTKETVHPPTGRVGKAVPEMTDGETKTQ